MNNENINQNCKACLCCHCMVDCDNPCQICLHSIKPTQSCPIEKYVRIDRYEGRKLDTAIRSLNTAISLRRT